MPADAQLTMHGAEQAWYAKVPLTCEVPKRPAQREHTSQPLTHVSLEMNLLLGAPAQRLLIP